MVDIACFRTGHCRHPSHMTLTGSGLAPRTYHAHAYLLRTARGNVLFDTGYATHFHAASAQGIYRLYPLVTPATLAAPLHDQLLAHGIDPASIAAVIVSHFHADHVAGLLDFPQARIVCAGDAWRGVRGRSGLPAVRRAFLPGLMPGDVQDRLDLLEPAQAMPLPADFAPFAHGWDLGGGDLFAVPLPGQAEGQIGLFARTAAGWTLLAADAAWHNESLATPRGPSRLTFLVQHDRRAYNDTLERLRALHARGQVRIRLSHDDEPDRAAPEATT